MKAVSLTRAPGQTIYAFPDFAGGPSLADWLTYRVKLAEDAAPNEGIYRGSLDESISSLWRFFVGASQPANWSQAKGYFNLGDGSDLLGEFGIEFQTQSEGVPISYAVITIKSNDQIIASGFSNLLGKWIVNLNPGEYSYTVTHAGFEPFTNITFTVNSDASFNVEMQASSATPSPFPNSCRITLITMQGTNPVRSRVLITSRSSSGNSDVRGFRSRAFDGQTDVNGQLVVDLPWSSTPGVGKYQFQFLDLDSGAVFHDRTCTVPDLASANYGDLL